METKYQIGDLLHDRLLNTYYLVEDFGEKQDKLSLKMEPAYLMRNLTYERTVKYSVHALDGAITFISKVA
jgi:hypothetical protein